MGSVVQVRPATTREGLVRLPRAAALAAALSVVGVFAVWSTAIYLWSLWRTDPLKSIGGLIPIVSLVLILRVWRALGWEMRGTWWGLAVLAVTVALVHVRDHAILELVLTPSWAIFIPPFSLVAVAYAAGAVLLFGGMRLLRAAVFPVALMWFVNPVPHVFNKYVDLPLQHASATLARGFAHALGQPLTPDQLRLMFTPSFGMFIAPGCDGIRGAITMGFLALIAGYVYRFRPRVLAMVVAAAVLLGYVFNFVRLCVLVLYYLVALKVTWLQSRAAMGDYIIGACLFFVATLLLFAAIRRWSPTHDLRVPDVRVRAAATEGEWAPASFLWRWVVFAALVAVGSVSYGRAMVRDRAQARVGADQNALGTFPQRVGKYTLKREWNEYLVAGPLIFNWAEYAPDGGGARVAVGISPVLGAHDTLLCHAARGDDWLWHGDLALPTADGVTNFSGSFFNDGTTQSMEATTVCTGETCGQYASGRKHFGLVYSRPDAHTLLSQSPERPIPILLKTETTNLGMGTDEARRELTANFAGFLQAARLAEFTRPYRER